MLQCPDCDSVKMFCDPPEGNGKCSACHGTGLERLFGNSTMEFMAEEQSMCEECYGTGQCQTCAGAGVIEEQGIRIAA